VAVENLSNPAPPTLGETRGEEMNGGQNWRCTATASPTDDTRLVMVDIDVVGTGNAALRKALQPTYPSLGQMSLEDYKVRVVNAREGTAARVRVVLESRDHRDVWTTVGVSENIVEASWLALVDSIEHKLIKDGAVPR
jgi:hypothetical protein